MKFIKYDKRKTVVLISNDKAYCSKGSYAYNSISMRLSVDLTKKILLEVKFLERKNNGNYAIEKYVPADDVFLTYVSSNALERFSEKKCNEIICSRIDDIKYFLEVAVMKFCNKNKVDRSTLQQLEKELINQLSMNKLVLKNNEEYTLLM